mgnify:CR=1 FL=1
MQWFYHECTNKIVTIFTLNDKKVWSATGSNLRSPPLIILAKTILLLNQCLSHAFYLQTI